MTWRETTGLKNCRFDSRLDGQEYRSDRRTKAHTEVSNLRRIDVTARLQVVDTTANILRHHDDVVSVQRLGLTAARHPVSTLVRALVDRRDQGSPTLQHEVERIFELAKIKVVILKSETTWGIKYGLKRRGSAFRKKHVRDHTLAAVRRVECYLFAGPRVRTFGLFDNWIQVSTVIGIQATKRREHVVGNGTILGQ